MAVEEKLSVADFSKKIKEKYPEYKDVPDNDLAKKMVEKYPEYGAQVDLGVEPLKKKEVTPSPLQSPSVDGTLQSTVTPSASQEPVLTTKNGQPFLEMNTQLPQGPSPTPVAVTTPGEINTQDQVFRDPNITKIGLKQNELKESLDRGIAKLVSSVSKTPAFLYDVSAAMATKGNPIMELALKKAGIGSAAQIGENLGIENPIAKELDEAVNRSNEALSQKYDKTITEYLFPDSGKPDYEKGFSLLANRVVENAPTSIALAIGNASGLSATGSTVLGGAVFGAEKKSQLDQSNPNMSEHDKVLNAGLTGLLEGATEQFGVTQLGGIAKKVFLEQGIDAAKKIAIEGYKKTYGKLLSRYLGVQAGEVIGEMANQFGENVVDKYSGADPNKKLSEGVIEAGLIGLGSSVSASAPVAALEIAKTKGAVKKAAEMQEQKKVLQEDLTSTEVSEDVKPAISEKIKQINEEETTLAKEEKDKFDTLPEESKKEVDTLLNESKRISDAIVDPSVSESTREIMTKDLNAVDSKIDKVYEDAKNEKVKHEEEKKANDDEWMKDFEKELKAPAQQEATSQTQNTETSVNETKKTEEAGKTNEAEVLNQGTQESPVTTETTNTETNATQEGNIQESNLTEHQNGDESGQTTTSSDSNSVQQGGEVQQEKVTQETTASQEAVVSSKKEKPKQELIDEEAQLEAQEKDDASSVKKLNDDITILKGFRDEGTATKKFKGIVERAFKMKEEGKISRPTYVKYRNMAQQIIGPKISVDAEQAKFKIETMKEEIKKKLLGENYKKIAMSAPGFGPSQVAHLIDLTALAAKKAVDAGFATKEAVERALKHIKNHPSYKKLVEEGHLKEGEFTKSVEDNFVSQEDIKKEKKAPKEKVENQSDKIFGPRRKKKTVKRLESSDTYNDIVANINEDDKFYESINAKSAVQYIDEQLDAFEKDNLLQELANRIIDNDNPFHEKISNLASWKLADRLRSIASKEGNEMQKSAVNKLAAKLLVKKNENTNIAATQTALEAEIAKLLPLSEEGLKEFAQASLSQAQDTYLTEKQKKDISDATTDINKLMETEEAQKAIRGAVEAEINKLAESTKGKDWVKEIDDIGAELMLDIKDC